MALERIEAVASTADLLGFPGDIVECRMPPLEQKPVWEQFAKRGRPDPEGRFHYAARDAMEAVGNPTTKHAIVPNPVDKGFLAYVGDMFGNVPVVHEVHLPEFGNQTVKEIMNRYHGAGKTVFYGWWAIDDLPPEHQLLPPNAQRWGNEKASLSQIYPEGVLAGQILLEDPRIRSNVRTIYDASEDELIAFKNGADRFWMKAARWGMAGHGVMPGQTIEDILRFYRQLVDAGVEDASVLLEEHLPGEGGSFTLIRRLDGRVVFSHVTRQLNKDGRREGNIIYDFDAAPRKTVDLIDLTAKRMSSSEFPDYPGIYVIDTIDGADGKPKPNDPANRSTGTFPSAYHRIHLISTLNLPRQDTVTWIEKLYLGPKTSFTDMMRALNARKLTDFVGNRIVTIRQYYNGHGGACVYLAHTTTNQDKLPSIQQEVQDALSMAGIANSSKVI